MHRIILDNVSLVFGVPMKRVASCRAWLSGAVLLPIARFALQVYTGYQRPEIAEEEYSLYSI
jgi:hypothetical protein